MPNSLRGASVSTPSRLTFTTSGARRGEAPSTFAVCPGDHLQRDYDIARIRFAAMQACLFLRSHMACRFGFIIAILTALVAAAPAKAQGGGEASGIWLTQAGGREGAGRQRGR